jgi:hypothetical protein
MGEAEGAGDRPFAGFGDGLRDARHLAMGGNDARKAKRHGILAGDDYV